ncbi:probable insulin-like peptide 1 [Zeugodacus cucurbitae]|uniref:probable insulin-like peptide 1 n=1 Tax=Zeugodacus cucurbitae TaxID=28588 RepID=UPI0010A74365|nr:probable insulin-like peptide 1 [Zeugodacus cucurbitae]
MSPILLKLLALLLIVLVEIEQSFGQQTICGPYLDMVLSETCTNGFNTRFKKSMEWNEQDNGDLDDELPFPYAGFPFLAKIHGGHVNAMAKSRYRRGIYDECCLKQCTLKEISSFCK